VDFVSRMTLVQSSLSPLSSLVPVPALQCLPPSSCKLPLCGGIMRQGPPVPTSCTHVCCCRARQPAKARPRGLQRQRVSQWQGQPRQQVAQMLLAHQGCASQPAPRLHRRRLRSSWLLQQVRDAMRCSIVRG
jgi:hypothetical protein